MLHFIWPASAAFRIAPSPTKPEAEKLARSLLPMIRNAAGRYRILREPVDRRERPAERADQRRNAVEHRGRRERDPIDLGERRRQQRRRRLEPGEQLLGVSERRL